RPSTISKVVFWICGSVGNRTVKSRVGSLYSFQLCAAAGPLMTKAASTRAIKRILASSNGRGAPFSIPRERTCAGMWRDYRLEPTKAQRREGSELSSELLADSGADRAALVVVAEQSVAPDVAREAAGAGEIDPEARGRKGVDGLILDRERASAARQ